ncbi:phospholipase A2, putative [Pediculus humanus corporis]|uniref:phospholipase A2 n=1 Tax=Pediculus humanus subsp. corporis TaxID=121224 RepID=E0VES3_PEDHC|nr:phospholipase A2, putative [Pediculus humanus corporis]EEB11879.1 phospholipase A2, putative [Pediculus humanus corporis]
MSITHTLVTLGLKLRQLTDGINFIQLIYNSDNQIQDCDYVKEKKSVEKFLFNFYEDLKNGFIIEKRQKINKKYEFYDKSNNNFLTNEKLKNYDYDDDDDYYEEEEEYIENDDDDDDDDDDGDYDEDRNFELFNFQEDDFDTDYEKEYRNISFQIIKNGGKLPGEFSKWMNYTNLRKKCNRNHKMFKKNLMYKNSYGNDLNDKDLPGKHMERVKRGFNKFFIFPGTKWCGKSSTAEKYTHLGNFYKVDKCCRAHDNCHPLIKSFDSKFHYFNIRPFTISHCRCDSRQKRDIMDVLRVPGTKWCGKGRRATKYTSLGGFSKTDKCCRVHDTMCPHWIGSMEEKYGLFNWRINTIMHCRCDKR